MIFSRFTDILKMKTISILIDADVLPISDKTPILKSMLYKSIINSSHICLFNPVIYSIQLFQFGSVTVSMLHLINFKTRSVQIEAGSQKALVPLFSSIQFNVDSIQFSNSANVANLESLSVSIQFKFCSHSIVLVQ